MIMKSNIHFLQIFSSAAYLAKSEYVLVLCSGGSTPTGSVALMISFVLDIIGKIEVLILWKVIMSSQMM